MKIKIEPEFNPESGKTVYAWTAGDKGGYCETEADARNDARIASETRGRGHTPGPWRVEQPYTDRNVFPISHEIYKSNCWGILAEVNAQGGTEIETSANARLIAAAPELLAVLKDTLNELQHWHGWRVSTSPGYATSDGFRICQKRIDTARAVIAKVEGAI